MDWIVSGPGFKPAHASWSRGPHVFPLSMPNFPPTVPTLPGLVKWKAGLACGGGGGQQFVSAGT